MRKIKRIKDLRLEQQKLNLREGELKQLIHADWIEIKNAARWKNILTRRLKREEKFDTHQVSTWFDGLSNGVGSLARKITQKTADSIEARVNERIESSLDNLFKRKWKAKSRSK